MADDDTTKNLTIAVIGKDNTGDTFKQVAAKAKKELGALDNLKDVLGKESGFGKAMEALKGAGAVAGLSILGEGLSKVTGKAVELRDAMKNGAGAGEIAAELGKSLPIFGGIIEAGQNIRELFAHEREEIERTNAEAKSANEYVDARRKTLELTTDTLREQADLMAEMRGERELLGLHGLDRDSRAIELDAQKGIKTVEEDAKKSKIADLKPVQDELKVKIAELDKLRSLPRPSVSIAEAVRESNGGPESDATKELRRRAAQDAILSSDIRNLQGDIKSKGGAIDSNAAQLRNQIFDTKNARIASIADDATRAEAERKRKESQELARLQLEHDAKGMRVAGEAERAKAKLETQQKLDDEKAVLRDQLRQVPKGDTATSDALIAASKAKQDSIRALGADALKDANASADSARAAYWQRTIGDNAKGVDVQLTPTDEMRKRALDFRRAALIAGSAIGDQFDNILGGSFSDKTKQQASSNAIGDLFKSLMPDSTESGKAMIQLPALLQSLIEAVKASTPGAI